MVIDETELEGLTEDQRDAYIALKEGRNVFLSGNAGTGKSYVLNRFIDDLLEKEKAAEKQAAPVNSAVEEALPWERENAPGRDYQSTWNQF